MSATPEKLRILGSQVLYEGWSTLRKVQATDGEQQLDQEVFDSGDAVAVLLYHPGRRVLLFVGQIRIATALNGNDSGRLLEVCAGRTEGRDPLETARREVREETGYEVEALEPVGAVYMSPGIHTQRLHMYAASYEGVPRPGEGGGLAEEQEQLELIELGYDEVRQRLDAGDIDDAKTLMMLQWAVIRGIL